MLAVNTLSSCSRLDFFAPANQVALQNTGVDSNWGMTVGDLNGDGRQDFVVPLPSLNQIEIRLGNGNGTFFQANTSPVSFNHNTGDVALGDFNGDGKNDIAVQIYIQGVAVLLGNGNGTFAAPTVFSFSSEKHGIAVSDFNGDGRQDLGASDSNDRVWALLGDGTGKFGVGVPSHSVANLPYSVATGDFNADGRQDLIASHINTAGNLSPLTGVSHGGFALSTPIYEENGAVFRSLETGDFNGDGKLDFAALKAISSSPGVMLFLGNNAGSFALSATAPLPANTLPWSLSVGDFNNDGRLDVGVANTSNFLSLFYGNGTGGLFSGVNIYGGTPTASASGDFNKDGRTDIAVTDSGVDRVSILFGQAAGGFGGQTNYTLGTNPRAVTTGDFNADGNIDLAIVDANFNNVSILLGNSGGTFTAAPNSLFSVGTSPRSVAVADLDGDDRLDLIVPNFGSNNVSILLGNGDGSFGAAQNFSAGVEPNGGAVGDFDGNGRQEFAVTNYNTSGAGTISVFLRQCALNFSQTSMPSATQYSAYQQTIAVTGGLQPYSFSVTGLPLGLSWNTDGETITISGIQASSGRFYPRIVVTDASVLGAQEAEKVGSVLVSNQVAQVFPLTVVGPTAAPVTIGGRVISASGRGISKAAVTITEAGGESRTVFTNAFGYYRFEGVSAGETYIFSVRHKRHNFIEPIQAHFINAERSDINFISQTDADSAEKGERSNF